MGVSLREALTLYQDILFCQVIKLDK